MVMQRVFAEVIGRPFLQGLVFPYFLFLFLVAAADASTNWQAARRQVTHFSPWAKTAILVGLIAAWSLMAGRALRPVWRQQAISFLLRQPLSSWEWTVRTLPSLSIALVPVAAIWWMDSYGANPLPHYLGFVGL